MTRFTKVAFAAVISAISLAGPVFAEPVCGVSLEGATHGEPIVVGSVQALVIAEDFDASNDTTNAYFDCLNANNGRIGDCVHHTQNRRQ